MLKWKARRHTDDLPDPYSRHALTAFGTVMHTATSRGRGSTINAVAGAGDRTHSSQHANHANYNQRQIGLGLSSASGTYAVQRWVINYVWR